MELAPADAAVVSPVNTFLSAANWYKRFAEEAADSALTLELLDKDGDKASDLELPGGYSGDVAVHEMAGDNFVGMLVENSEEKNFSSEILRVYPEASGRIGAIMNIPSMVIAKEDFGELPELRSCASIEQYGITWSFDKKYNCGQFVNGDWWVLGPVTVTSISPAPYYAEQGSAIECSTSSQSPINYEDVCSEVPDAKRGCVNSRCVYHIAHNGYQINPVGAGHQTLESRASHHYNNGNYSHENRPPALPLALAAEQSLVSAVSNPLATDCIGSAEVPGWLNYQGGCYSIPLKTAAVLTVLAEAPADVR